MGKIGAVAVEVRYLSTMLTIELEGGDRSIGACDGGEVAILIIAFSCGVAKGIRHGNFSVLCVVLEGACCAIGQGLL